MRKVIAAVCVLLITSAFAHAQAQTESAKAEIFGGFQRLSADLPERKGFYGWNTSITGNLNRNFGLVVEAGGSYGHVSVPPVQIGAITVSGFDENASYHSFLVGPRLSGRDNLGALFCHALFGGVKKSALSNRRVDIEIPNFDPLPSPIIPPIDIPGLNSFNPDPRLSSDTGFAMAIGGGVDIAPEKGLGWRAIQVDYMPARLNGRWEHNIRLQVGLIYRFGGD